MNQHHRSKVGAGMWLSLTVRLTLFATAIIWPAGTWLWWEAWALIGLWGIFAIAITADLARHDPALLAERMKASPVQKGQKAWDKILMLPMVVIGFGLYLIPGFDVVRFGWSEPLPVWIEILAMAVHLPCFAAIAWVMRENTYLSRVVKIDEARGHRVITTGLYALVRHPMYSAVIVLVFAMPTALGSRFGLIPAALLAVLFIVRTYFEDRTLHAELPDYPEYAKQTRYRLIPGVW